MRCPVCETENPDDVAECANCGKPFKREAQLLADVSPLPGFEGTRLEADPDAQSSWSLGQVELDRGREQDLAPKTLPPQEDGLCPWCGAEGQGAVCDACGQRRSRYTQAPSPAAKPRRADDDAVLCPSCFGRVPKGPRCVECGVPFVVPED
jgi:hypothetical protein